MDLERAIRQCEDHLFTAKKFTMVDRSLYYHLLRLSRIEGNEQIRVGIGRLARELSIADITVKNSIRTLHERDCIRIDDRSGNGHLIHVPLPEEIPGVVPTIVDQTPINLDELDFYTGRRFINALLERENGRCFYCFKMVDSMTPLDHVHSRVGGTNNSYRNIVVACQDCNSTKQDTPANDFVRTLYRNGVLSQDELSGRLRALEQLEAGLLQPNVEHVRAAI